jgi:hypothetical protein
MVRLDIIEKLLDIYVVTKKFAKSMQHRYS